jgi:AcrR family transcriptional regulator
MPAGERREQLLAAALEVFGGRGYHGTSIDDIARRAGVSKGLIYEHFGSKKELHESLLEAHVQELFARLSEAAGTDAPGEERLRAGVDAFLAFVEQRREGWRLLFRDAADPDLAELVQRLQAQATAAIAELIAAEPAARPHAGGPELEMIAQQLSGAVQALANWWYDHRDVPREELVARVMDFAWVGLRELAERR